MFLYCGIVTFLILKVIDIVLPAGAMTVAPLDWTSIFAPCGSLAFQPEGRASLISPPFPAGMWSVSLSASTFSEAAIGEVIVKSFHLTSPAAPSESVLPPARCWIDAAVPGSPSVALVPGATTYGFNVLFENTSTRDANALLRSRAD